MGPESTSFLQRHRRRALPVLTLASLSALAAAAYTGSQHPASGQAATRGTPAAPAATAATASTISAKAMAYTPVSGWKANAIPTPGWTSVKKAVQLQSGITATDAPSAQPLRISVDLKLRDLPGLQTYINGISTPGNTLYGQSLSTEQFNATYAPTPAAVQAVSDYLAAQGFRNITVSGNRVLVSADGTAGLVAAAFNTHLVDFTWQNQNIHANTTDVQVPTALQGLVQSVLGVSNVPVMHLFKSTASPVAKAGSIATPYTATAVDHPGYTGQQYATAYDGQSVTPAYGTTVAIVSLGTDLKNVLPQLLLAERVNKLPVVPVKIVQVVPVPNTQMPDNDGEWDLDVQSSTSLAENVKGVIFYNGADFGDATTVGAANAFASDNIAKVGNMSFGGCESLDIGDFTSFEQAYMQAVAQGQTWFASTGDAGSACFNAGQNGTPAGVEGVSYPASSPNVVGVGGTTLNTDANFNYVSEVAWTDGGGGISQVFAAPSWQVSSGAVMSAVAPGLPTGAATDVPASESGVGRGIPDVSMVGDSATGFITYVLGSAEQIGGTSLSSPAAMGAYARIQTAHCNKLGFASPLIYALDTKKGANSTANGFHDVTSGTNGAYMAGTGWDYTTGFGTFDIAAVNKNLPGVNNCQPIGRPVAKLTANTTKGPGPLSVTYSGSTSTDSAGNALVQYILDYGDGSDLVIQGTPVFPAHTYAPGTYTATLIVRDAADSASLPFALPITVYGEPQACIPPGITVLTSPAGLIGTPVGTVQSMTGMDPTNGQGDVLAGSITEPAGQSNLLIFTLKVASLSGGPAAGYRWMFFFNIPEDAKNHYVAMTTGNGSTPVFNYGIRTAQEEPGVPVLVQSFAVQGLLEPASTFSTKDGTITMVLDKTKMGLKTGDALTGLEGETRLTGPDSAMGAGATLDAAGAAQPYVLLGNDVCAADAANPSGPTTPTPTTGGMTSPTTTGSGSGGGMTSPTTTGSGSGGGMGSPTTTGSGSGGGTASPTTGGNSSSGTGLTTVTTGGGSREVEAGRGGTGSGALGWLVLLPLSAGALRRRKADGRRARR